MGKKINTVLNLFKKMSKKAGFYVLYSFIFMTTFGYFYWVGYSLLNFQEQQFLFVFSYF